MRFRTYCLRTLRQLHAASIMMDLNGMEFPPRAARLYSWLNQRYGA